LKMDRIREWPAVSLAIASGVGIFLIGRALSRKRDILTITVPATTANLACGFDVFGAAFEFRMIVKTRLAPPTQTETRFIYEGEGADEVSTCESNLIWQSALACIKMHAPGRTMPKLNVSVKNPVPFGRGLGSSATAIAAGVVLANEYLALRLNHEQLLDAALQMENHPDNLAAALWGGAVASGVSEGGRSMVRPFRINRRLKAVVLVPDFQLSTEKARGVLPKEYGRADVVFNLQRAALLPLALSARTLDVALVRECFKDRIHQNQRAPLVPGLRQALDLPHEGRIPELVATALSGAGPTILALATGRLDDVGRALQALLAQHGIQSRYFALQFADAGTTVAWS